MRPKFIYFDLGKVLINFSVERMLRQVADVAGISVEKVRSIVFSDGLQRKYESGKLTDREFYEAFCAAADARPDFDAMARAASEIFDLNLPILPLVAHLRQAGYSLGILSNTCGFHWDYCSSRYRIVHEFFDVHALSFRIGAVKPEPEIFRAAATLAGVRPEEIFFIDDLPQHVEGAKSVGFDAMQFTSASALAEELRKRGIRFNY